MMLAHNLFYFVHIEILSRYQPIKLIKLIKLIKIYHSVHIFTRPIITARVESMQLEGTAHYIILYSILNNYDQKITCTMRKKNIYLFILYCVLILTKKSVNVFIYYIIITN